MVVYSVYDDDVVVCFSHTILLAQTDTVIAHAEDGATDLIPNAYEGGMKVWECTGDLIGFLHHNALLHTGMAVLEVRHAADWGQC